MNGLGSAASLRADAASGETPPQRPPPWRRPRYRAVQRVQRTLWGRAYVDIGGDQRDTLYVAGSGKSGTTWLAELLNDRNDHRYMFEPLTPPHVQAFSHFRRGQYLRPGNRDPSYRQPLEAVISGRIRNRWVDHLNCTPLASKRLIKDIHGNLLLKWLHVNMPGIRIVFVVRHPLAVIVSRLNTAPFDPFHQFEPRLGRFLEQEDLVTDFLRPFAGAIASASTPLEQHAYAWCIENYVPLRQFQPGQIHMLCYEHLRWTPQDELPRLAAYLERDFEKNVLEKMHRPSRTAGYDSSLSKGLDPATAWTRRCSRDDVRTVLGVLAKFGLDEIYTDNAAPRLSDPSTIFSASS